MAKVVDIEGVGPLFAQKLQTAGISTAEAQLKAGATPEGRKELAAKSSIDHDKILSWVNFAVPYHIKGVGSVFAFGVLRSLFETLGIDLSLTAGGFA